MTIAHSESRFGPSIEGDEVRFRLWAPRQTALRLEVAGQPEPVPMTAIEGGWFEAKLRTGCGTLYRFELGDGTRVPDPASRFQPDDVHGFSEVIDPGAYTWADAQWRGRPWHEAVIYEMHLGTFTPEGTFAAAAARLDHLVELGVTAVQVMPVADFPGKRSWGYDGVLLYAPDSAYGRPEEFKAFIDAAHHRGIMVMLDVVYNHFGPDGNYLSLYSSFFTAKHRTPWGEAINYDDLDSGPVREFMVRNAVYWISEFHLDGLRLDAVHEIRDGGPTHLLAELAAAVHAAVPERNIHLVLENEDNDPVRLSRADPACFTAQWNDDVHHALHVAVTGESAGYYGDYAGQPELLARALAQGFAFQGQMMAYRGSARGAPSDHLPPQAFIAFLQNHDQIGNRAFGDRITTIARPEAVRAAAAIYLLSPQIPMLFQGEEWGATQPFPFFCDFSGDLADAVRDGRRAEFARFPEFSDAAKRAMIPDPVSEATFLSAKLRWQDIDRPPHAAWLAWYRHILAVRRDVVIPLMPGILSGGSDQSIGGGAFVVGWTTAGGHQLRLEANLADTPIARPLAPGGSTFWSEGEIALDRLGAWSVAWTLA